MSSKPTQPDLERLRAEYPLWEVRAEWMGRTSGPDIRMLTASRAGLRLGAASAVELQLLMDDIEHRYSWPRRPGEPPVRWV